jgi:sulfoxide reductase heme-binding subunit YedZ
MDGRMITARATMATGYIALGLVTFTLLIGPANLLLRRRNPVSNYLRRDAGAWAAVASVVHTIVGLQVHGPPGDLTRQQDS